MRIHFIKAGDDFVLFQCDALRMYRVSKDTKRIIEGLASEDDIRELRSNPGRIQFQGSHAAAALSSVSPARQRTVGEYLGLTLNVSNMCNMACRYCYAEGGTYHSPKRLMSKETARLAVDFFMRQRGKITDIKFFGGEPLLNVPVIEDLCQYVNSLHEAGTLQRLPSWKLVTNGTVMNSCVAEVIRQFGIRVTVSMDGPQDIHDQLRVYADGRGTYDDIIKNIRMLQDATSGKQPSAIEVTYTALHEERALSMLDVMNHLRKATGINTITMGLVGATPNQAFKARDADCCARLVKDVFRLKAEGYDCASIEIKALMSAITNREAYGTHICLAGLNRFCVSAAGDICPCHFFTDIPQFCLGSIYQDALETPQFRQMQGLLKSSSHRLSSSCGDCFANRLCTGCIGGNYLSSGDMFQKSSFTCEIVRNGIESLLLEMSAEAPFLEL